MKQEYEPDDLAGPWAEFKQSIGIVAFMMGCGFLIAIIEHLLKLI